MAKILDIGLAVVIWATSELAWLLGICQSPDVRQMNQQKSKQYRRYLSNTDLTAYLCDKSRSSYPRWPGQSSWWAASAVTGSWSWLSWQLPTWEWSGHWEHEPQIERGGHSTQHRSTRKSGDTGGHRLLASANMMRTWVQSFINYPGQGIKSSQISRFYSTLKWLLILRRSAGTKQKPLQLSMEH